MRSASLNKEGTEAVTRERLMMVESTLSKAGYQVLKREAGIGSRLQYLIGDLAMNFLRVSYFWTIVCKIMFAQF